MIELSIPEYDIRITEQSDGLLIYQKDINSECEREYLAKDWTLSRPVYGIIRTAIKKGFTCLWTKNNPVKGKKDTTYICFSRSHSDPWDFKLNKEGHGKSFDGESLVEVITVNTIREDKLTKKIRFYKIKQEDRVRHLEVRPCDLHKLLNLL